MLASACSVKVPKQLTDSLVHTVISEGATCAGLGEQLWERVRGMGQRPGSAAQQLRAAEAFLRGLLAILINV